MIIAWNDLPALRGKVVMVDGSFDPLHDGHIAYFEASAALNLPVLCNVATDELTSRKHRVLLPQLQRARVIDAIRYISYVHCAGTSTYGVLEQLRPHTYVKGADWKQRGGVPADEQELCRRLGIAIHYAETMLNSSTRLIEQLQAP
jgi:cytidyltransferase-like protein